MGHLDRQLFGHWFNGRRQPLHLLGSSIGSWRFAAASCADPAAAIDRMEAAYIHQTYTTRPSPREISDTSRAILEETLGETGPAEILTHPVNRLGLLAVRCRGLIARQDRFSLGLGLTAAMAANFLHRRLLGLFFRQTLFHDPRSRPPYPDTRRWPRDHAPLSAANLKAALLASGSIPWVMQGVDRIASAPPGIYRDGGVVDYHLDIPYGLDGQGIVLYPHFSRRVIPGWFDKRLPQRHPSAEHLADVLVVAPSDDCISRLPNGKVADRTDFYRYAGNDKARFAAWQQVADTGRRLADVFMENVASGRIRYRVRPLQAS